MRCLTTIFPCTARNLPKSKDSFYHSVTSAFCLGSAFTLFCYSLQAVGSQAWWHIRILQELQRYYWSLSPTPQSVIHWLHWSLDMCNLSSLPSESTCTGRIRNYWGLLATWYLSSSYKSSAFHWKFLWRWCQNWMRQPPLGFWPW